MRRIQKLPLQLANQIAAGEVVERPASVLKELLENSIDAGSTQIDVALEKGGIGLIRVQDNGCGICKEDLPLALAPHATSKIQTLSDLEEVQTYGFRGEALASIGSVSRLKLFSSVPDAETGWMFSSAGRNQFSGIDQSHGKNQFPAIDQSHDTDQSHKLQPAPKTIGTTIEVADLFYNTPARRKFLKSERTELQHLEEVFKRVVLSQPKIAFSLRINDQKPKRFSICNTKETETRRVGLLCGQKFIQQAEYLEAEANGLKLKGWLGNLNDLRPEPSLQYCYVNGRIVRDKVITHAVRSAYQSVISLDKYPTFVLFFELDPAALDVNVHPTKHEVRFREPRTVHAFLHYSIQEALKSVQPQQNFSSQHHLSQNSHNKSDYSFCSLPESSLAAPTPLAPISFPPQSSLSITVFCDDFLIAENPYESPRTCIFLHIPDARQDFLFPKLLQEYHHAGIQKRPLNSPIPLPLRKKFSKLENSITKSSITENTILENPTIDWNKLGFEWIQSGPESIIIKSLPNACPDPNNSPFHPPHPSPISLPSHPFNHFFLTLISQKTIEEAISLLSHYIITHTKITIEEAEILLTHLEQSSPSKKNYYRKFLVADLKSTLF